MTHSTAFKVRWRLLPASVGLLVMLASVLAPALSARAAQRWFKSAQGGYQVGIPKDWHVKEIVASGAYQAALSREKVEKEGDLYLYGVSVVRLRDWHSMFKFASTDPSAMALEYANRVAAEAEGKGQSSVIGLPGPLRGMQSSLFRITKQRRYRRLSRHVVGHCASVDRMVPRSVGNPLQGTGSARV